jgi:hypothetical protein
MTEKKYDGKCPYCGNDDYYAILAGSIHNRGCKECGGEFTVIHEPTTVLFDEKEEATNV